MNHWPLQDANSMNAYFGNPDKNADGMADPKWVSENIVRILPPFPMFLSWQPETQWKTIPCHRLVAPSLTKILSLIGQNFSAEDRAKYQLDHLGGCFNFRRKRGGETLSIHSWGAAIDISPALNGMGVEWGSRPRMLPRAVAEIFRAEDWVWGVDFNSDDVMHFQAARLK